MPSSIQRRIAIPEPVNEVDSLWSTAKALKEAIEVGQGIRGNREYALKGDLLDQVNNLQVQILNISGDGDGILDQVLSSSSGVLTINFILGQSVFVAMDENITSTVVTGLPIGKLAQIELEIDQDDPVRTWVWPSPITWIGGTEPDLSVVDAKYLVRLRTRDAGTSWMGTFGEDFS